MIKAIATVSSFISILIVCFIYASPFDYKVSNAGVCSPEIKKAIYKMGPKKDYRLHPSGKLEVKVNGEWLRLNYERR